MRTAARNVVPPWTTRWPTASAVPRSRNAASTSASSKRPPDAARSCHPTTRSSPASSRSLRLLEPALTTSTCTSVGPDPVAHVRRVLAVLTGVLPVPQPFVHHLLPHVRGPAAEARDPVDDVHDEPEPVEVVEHDHVERRGRRPLLLVPADMEVGVVGAPVGQPVDQPRVAVVGE